MGPHYTVATAGCGLSASRRSTELWGAAHHWLTPAILRVLHTVGTACGPQSAAPARPITFPYLSWGVRGQRRRGGDDANHRNAHNGLGDVTVTAAIASRDTVTCHDKPRGKHRVDPESADRETHGERGDAEQRQEWGCSGHEHQ